MPTIISTVRLNERTCTFETKCAFATDVGLLRSQICPGPELGLGFDRLFRSTLNSVGLRGSTHIYEITSLRRDGCVGGMAGGRAGGGGVGRKQSTGAIGGLNSKNVLFGPSNALTNPQGNSVRIVLLNQIIRA